MEMKMNTIELKSQKCPRCTREEKQRIVDNDPSVLTIYELDEKQEKEAEKNAGKLIMEVHDKGFFYKCNKCDFELYKEHDDVIQPWEY